MYKTVTLVGTDAAQQDDETTYSTVVLYGRQDCNDVFVETASLIVSDMDVSDGVFLCTKLIHFKNIHEINS